MSILKLSFEKRPIADETPQSLFEHVRGDYAFLLESAALGESSAVGRYSFIGYDPFLFAWSQKGVMQMMKRKSFFGYKKSPVRQIVEGEPLQILREIFDVFEMKGRSPVPFYGGAAGYFSYDFGCRFTGVEQKVFDDQKLPDFCFSFVDKVIAFDHEKRELYLLALAETDAAAERKVEEIKKDLQSPAPLRRKGMIGGLESNLNRAQYGEKIARVTKLLGDGETYQVNFSQRFSAECTREPWSIYKNLAQRSPAPFACFFEYPDFAIVSSSPELLLRKRGRKLETRPIKGTVPRGNDEDGDRRRIEELLASGKDAAELSMIVDLARNDLGKVCEIGSVKVAAHRDIQKLSHVIHTYSRVSGTLAKKKDVFDVLEAVFPGGSITGCPKKRTMEIIDQLEDYRRGIYTGSAGYVSFSGDADLNILIRTMLLKDSRVFFHSGGGIVIDSDPAKEYEETLYKAEAMKSVLPENGG